MTKQAKDNKRRFFFPKLYISISIRMIIIKQKLMALYSKRIHLKMRLVRMNKSILKEIMPFIQMQTELIGLNAYLLSILYTIIMITMFSTPNTKR